MNDFLIAALAKEHQTRLAREASIAAMIRDAEGGRQRPPRRRGRRIHPRND